MTSYRQRALDLLTAVYGPGPHSDAAVDVQIRQLRASDDFPGGDDFAHLDYDELRHQDRHLPMRGERWA